MRKIIILQSIIILAGAYYIYTLQQDRLAEERETSSRAGQIDATINKDDTAAPATTESPAAATTEAESSSEIGGASDVGMEFPIPDDEADLQVR